MASSALLSFLIAFSVLAAGAAARPGIHFHPCRTVFISYTFTSETFNLPQISPRDRFSTLRPLSFTALTLRNHDFRPMIPRRPVASAEMVPAEPSFGMSSLQERAKDILVVVAGLLFGVGCGALTGAIMYLAWSLFANHYDIYKYDDAEDEEEQEETPKKMGYVMIASAVPAKEGLMVKMDLPSNLLGHIPNDRSYKSYYEKEGLSCGSVVTFFVMMPCSDVMVRPFAVVCPCFLQENPSSYSSSAAQTFLAAFFAVEDAVMLFRLVNSLSFRLKLLFWPSGSL